MELTYGDDLIDVKVEEISDAYLDALDEYIRADIVIPGKYALTFQLKVKKSKKDASVNPILEKKSNTILDTRIYELEFLDRCI